LIELDNSMGYHALEWLRENQLADGSWGGSIPYSHDRVICTLAAMIALKKWGDQNDKRRIRKARLGLDRAFKGISTEVATVGFELIVPLLLEEAYHLGAIRRLSDRNLITFGRESDEGKRREDFHAVQMAKGRQMKLKAIGSIDRNVTTAFSAEMVGDDLHLLDVNNLQETNGSVGCSPAATAFFALNVRRGDESALNYLKDMVEKSHGYGIPDFAPFEIYEIAWALWNLSLGGVDDNLKASCKPHLDLLAKSWTSSGVSYSSEYTPKDGDDTFLVFDTLRRYGRTVDLDVLLKYEEADHFRCFSHELNPSVTANAHALGALREADYEVDHPSIKKIKNFLQNSAQVNTFWADKWHSSPYYATSQVIITSAGYVEAPAISNAVEWIIDTQRGNGSWGFYRPTLEESALCLQALFIWQRNGGNVSDETLRKGIQWLVENHDRPYEHLWICKCLYTPPLIVRSIILSALKLGENYIGS
jgi:halimadienyl-diphosphate synthase